MTEPNLSKLVSEEAERVDSYYQVAESLQKALTKVLNGSGWWIDVGFDMPRLGFVIHLQKTDWRGKKLSVQRFVSDEELNLNTESKMRFSKYVRTLAHEMRQEGGDTAVENEGGWYEARGVRSGGFLTQLVRNTNTAQPHFFVDRSGNAHQILVGPQAESAAPEVDPEEELDAVASVAESIKRLDERRER